MSVQTATATDSQSAINTHTLTIHSDDPDDQSQQQLVRKTEHALQLAARYSFNTRHEDGHWCGELKSNATITAEYVMLRQALGLDLSLDKKELIAWFLSEQNENGSWAIAPEYPGDISVTTEAYLALKLLGVDTDQMPMRKARQFILSVGGVAKVRIFTRIYLATFGLFPWKAVPELPAELILMPSMMPINIYRLSSWARSTIVPLLIVAHHRPIYALPNGKSETNDFLDELWKSPGPADKVVPYSLSIRELFQTDTVAFAFTAVDAALCWVGGLRRSPTRGFARRKCIEWILEHQEEEGDWAGIFPPMHLGILALRLEGFALDDSVIVRGLEAIERFSWNDNKGKRIQACISPIWDTILTTIGLCDAGHNTGISSGVNWIKAHQLLGPEGDWRVYQPSIPPGGFSFEYFNKWYPDVDDTAAAILAMVKQDPHSRCSFPVLRAVEWTLGMQNHDGGWGAFDNDNDSLFLNKIPFSDMDSLCDPSSADVTGRILEAFGLVMQMSFTGHSQKVPDDLVNRMSTACDRALDYLAYQQELDGVWYGRWGSNYIYGTSNVLCGLAYFATKETGITEINESVKSSMDDAIRWLKVNQNRDGGWGETLMSYQDAKLGGNGPSTASQTAWALMGLLSYLPVTDKSVQSGVQFLLRTQCMSDKDDGATWLETQYTGTGFPKHFYLGYSLYPHYFPMMALGRFLQLERQQANRLGSRGNDSDRKNGPHIGHSSVSH
ncbi:hypothetical protein N7452_007922 [Penicillium brevicompactum]|uniref:Terpene cyclase/mutase family member n=1 Tax=Penicillium brevicompactum TaxID=5074 RepID=A0A9W9UDY9_PENBR|nr:hypothetical protein N7452_007922 [Penicillium brevicompactum]